MTALGAPAPAGAPSSPRGVLLRVPQLSLVSGPNPSIREERSSLEAHELLTSNLAVIERTVAFACRRYRLSADDAEEFAAVVNLKLVENDYAILRKYEERCSFSTFISVVVQRMALDYRIHTWGKWHASAEAKRLGPLAVRLDQLLHRDGQTFEQAFAILAARHEGLGRESLQQLAERLPRHPARRRDVSLEDAGPVGVTRSDAVEERLMARDRRNTSERLSEMMSAVIKAMPEDERLILQLRFEGGMAVSQIARVLGLDQKLLYRRLERRMRDIRVELERSGLVSGDVLDLIGRDETLLDFELGKQIRRPSIAAIETVAADSEGSQ
jgi:RNA polymerase sigma factor (sigma-70 family)